MYLLNEGTIAVGVMTAALAFAFLMVVALGAYVVYCDSLNRVGETAADPPAVAGAEPATEPTARTRRRTGSPREH